MGIARVYGIHAQYAAHHTFLKFGLSTFLVHKQLLQNQYPKIT